MPTDRTGWSRLGRFLGQFYLWSIILGGSIFLVEWHTGRVSQYIETLRPPLENSRAENPALPLTAEEDQADLIARWEQLSRDLDYKTLIKETEGRKDPVARAYHTLAILESGLHPILLPEAFRELKALLLVSGLPNNLDSRLVRALGDPEAPGPTDKENLEAFRDIVNSLNIATQPSSLKKLRELEKLAAEEAESR